MQGEIPDEPQFSVTGVPPSVPLTCLQLASYIFIYPALNNCCIYFSSFFSLFLFPTKLGTL